MLKLKTIWQKFKKWIIGFLIGGTALAAGIGAINEPVVIPIDKIDTTRGEIKMEYTDDNTDETFVLKTDKAKYGGNNNYDVYLAVTNLRNDEFGVLNLVSSTGQTIKDVSVYFPTNSTVDEPVFSNLQINCQQATSTDCYEKVQTGTTTKNVVIDNWQTITKRQRTIQNNFFKKTIKGEYADEEIIYLFKKGTTFLKMNIDYQDKLGFRDEFYLEIFGENGGYGHLDPLTDSLVSYWKFDEASGNAADAHGSNTMVNQGSTPFSAGKINNAANLNGGGSQKFKIAHADQTGLDLMGDFTLQVWLKTTDNGEYVIGFTDGGTGAGYGLNIGGAGAPAGKLALFGGAGWAQPNNTAVNTGNWVHIVGTYVQSTGAVVFYVNGANDGNKTAGTVPESFTGDRIIGGLTGNLAADIDEIAIWSRVLSASEVTELYNSGAGWQYPFISTVQGEDYLIIFE